MDATDEELLEFFAEFVSEERKRVIERVLGKRTRHITVVLEDIYQSQNANAVIRTCDCFGIQDLHVIENIHEFSHNPRVVHGSTKWVNIYQYNENESNTVAALDSLKSKGYVIVGTLPDTGTRDIHAYDFSRPTALVFGTEATGLSEEALSACDDFVTYPMAGFTESLNVSVSASLCLGVAVRDMYRRVGDWQLSENEKEELRLAWYRMSVSRNEVVERVFRKKMK